MPTLSKFQWPRARSKTTKKNNTIICSEITPHKIQKPHPTSRRENPRRKSAESVRPTKNSPPRNQANSPHFTHQKESSQSIYNANQLTDFHKRRAPIKRYFKTDWDNRSINKWQVTCSMYNLFDRCNSYKVYMDSCLDTII